MTSQGRDLAVLALSDRMGYVSASLDRLIGRGRISDADRSLAYELALGAHRRRGTLDAVLRAFLARPGKRLPITLNSILHVALYQLLFLTRVPDFAAVDEAVDQAKRLHHNRQKDLVNAVLRTVIRNVSDRSAGRLSVSCQVLPTWPGEYRTFTRAVLADPQAQPAEYLADAYSLPLSLTRRWLGRYGFELACRLGMHSCCRPAIVLRVNKLKASLEGAMAELAADEVGAQLHANGQSIVIAQGGGVRNLRAVREGLVQPQDPTATAVVLAAGPAGGQRVLDFCAAPGTKTTHLAELMSNRGEIIAVDVSAEKIDRISARCAEMGVSIVRTLEAGKLGSLELAGFDLVLVDAPCSNTGVLARRVEARWRFAEDALGRLAGDQKRLAVAAAEYVRPGGRLVYSTCSIEPEECSEVSRWLVKRKLNLQLIDEQLTLPSGADEPRQWCDGGYYAVFRA